MTRSALLAVQVAVAVGIIACIGQLMVIWDNWKNWQAVKSGTVNGNLHRIVRWALWFSPFVLGMFAYLTFLAYFGVQAGEPETVTLSGLYIRWSYSVVMLICMAWSYGDLIIRRGLK